VEAEELFILSQPFMASIEDWVAV